MIDDYLSSFATQKRVQRQPTQLRAKQRVQDSEEYLRPISMRIRKLWSDREAEKVLKAKQDKYGKAPTDFNENTAFVVRYLTEFLAKLGIRPENLGL